MPDWSLLRFPTYGSGKVGMPLRVSGDDVVAAVHAKYLRPELFGKLEISNPPPSWRKGFADPSLELPITSLVYGVLPTYDWTDLVK